MQLIKPDTNINFIGKRKIAFILSLTLIVITVVSLIAKGGPNYGIDFAGGTLIQIRFSESIVTETIKKHLGDLGLEKASVQQFGHVDENEYLIRAEKSSASLEGLADKIRKNLEAACPDNKVEVRRVEMVGPKVGKDLREKALQALFAAILLIAVYISGRFELKWITGCIVAVALLVAIYFLTLLHVPVPALIFIALLVTLGLCIYLNLKYALGAIVALLHDVIITVGIFSLTGKEFTLPIVAALLTIVGYSLNDTIIVFDRIRENLRRYHKESLAAIINRSINQTLSRTILTSITTLMVVVSLLIFGGGIIHDFAFAMVIGIIAGTYSSIYVASPILILWHQSGTRSWGFSKKRHFKPLSR
jgi:preprotein translocase subunit SecF